MRIATRIRLGAVFAVIIAAVAGVVLLAGLQSVDSALSRGAQATEALTSVFELSMLTTDYLANHEPRAQAQWHDEYISLTALLAEIEVREDDEAVIARFEENLVVAHEAFEEIHTTHERSHATDQAVAREYELRLTSRLLVLMQSMVTDAVLLERHAADDARSAQQLTIIVVMLVSAVGVLTMTLIGLSTNRTIIVPLEALRQSAARVGRGDLDVRSGIESPDEVGEFAMAFDNMVHGLQQSYVMLENENTERRRAERELSEYRDHLEQTVQDRTAELMVVNEDLQRATRAKDDFLASMSHELRTPLNSVIGFTDLMLKGRTGELNDEQRRQIRMVNDAGQQLLSLVNEVLELSRIDAGVLSILDAPFDPTEAVGRLVEMMAPVAAGKGLDLNWSAAETVPHRIVTDRGRLDQILLNLIGNAIKFTAHGGVDVVVRAEGPDAIAFSVEDSGIGIAPADFEAVFEHFRQVQTGPAGEAGAGLGLSISRRLAEALGGTLTVASEVGEGSIFTLTLPVERAAREPDVTDAEG
ncbi:MAG: ATP-binding protein [Coriobacteriia bacterium]